MRKLLGENLRFVCGIGGELIAEFSGSTGALQKEYIYGASGLLATIIEGAVDKATFDKWQGEGKGGFSIALANGKTEKGRVEFGGTDGFGSVHDGYNVQGYTSANSNFPRIQWNYRRSDGGIDIDLDGHKPWLVPFVVPNPKHKGNSVVPPWFKSYEKKFGNPGFSVREIKKKK